jgi:hypothetical protein
MESAADYGASTRVSFASYDRDSSSWKTSQLCLDGAWSEFSATWPRAGMTRNGKAFELPMLAPHTGENESGLLPTPEATNTKAVHLRTQGRPPRTYFPTPSASRGGYNQSDSPGAAVRPSLDMMAKNFPTPRASAAMANGKAGRDDSDARLEDVIQNMETFRTPSSRDWKGQSAASWRDRETGDLTPTLPDQIGGQLNPTWVELLMGYPPGWTDLT